MKNIKFCLFAALFSLFFLQGYGQDLKRVCATMENHEDQLRDNPLSKDRMRQIETFTKNYLKDKASQKVTAQSITIPIVFHVVYRTASENISNAALMSQLQVLNDDFRRMNGDADNTWPQAADTEIQFCLAKVDPCGNSTTGITRTSTTVTSHGTNNSVKFAAQGGKDAWPSDSYLNFWVCNIGSGILGYAQFPGGNAITDGVVCDYRFTGTTSSLAPYNLGRTGTHEVGHWLNLRHIWGDGGCSVDDLVADTPVSDAQNYGCIPSHVSCGTTDMVQNYMDYSNDNCMNLFTQGQKDRMQALFTPGGARASLLNSVACHTASSLTLSGTVSNTQNFTASTITSTQTLTATANVDYTAGSFIRLLPGFTATEGSDLIAQIEGCDHNIRAGDYEEVAYNEDDSIENDDDFGYENPPLRAPKSIERGLHCYPNPFTQSTTITYHIANEGPIRLSIHDLNGRLVAELANGNARPGERQTRFEAKNLPAGIYYVQLLAEGRVRTAKLIVGN